MDLAGHARYDCEVIKWSDGHLVHERRSAAIRDSSLSCAHCALAKAGGGLRHRCLAVLHQSHRADHLGYADPAHNRRCAVSTRDPIGYRLSASSASGQFFLLTGEAGDRTTLRNGSLSFGADLTTPVPCIESLSARVFDNFLKRRQLTLILKELLAVRLRH